MCYNIFMDSEQRIQVGMGVMIFKGEKVLLGKRKGSFSPGEYGFPGGYMEFMESFNDCVVRETREEAGIEIENVRFLFLGNLKDFPPKHFIQISMIADWKIGEPKIMEPDKCDGWGWYSLSDLPSPIFLPTQLAIDAYIGGTDWKDFE